MMFLNTRWIAIANRQIKVNDNLQTQGCSRTLHPLFHILTGNTCGNLTQVVILKYWTTCRISSTVICRTSMKTCHYIYIFDGLGPRIPPLWVYHRESFTSFHVQAVLPVILVKPIDTLPLAFVNILPPTHILTSLSTWEVLKIVAPFVQKIVLKSSPLLQQVSNWKLKKPSTSFGSSRR